MYTSLPAVPVAYPVRSINLSWVATEEVAPFTVFVEPPLTIKAYASSSDLLIVCMNTSSLLLDVTPAISAMCSVQGLFSSPLAMCDRALTCVSPCVGSLSVAGCCETPLIKLGTVPDISGIVPYDKSADPLSLSTTL